MICEPSLYPVRDGIFRGTCVPLAWISIDPWTEEALLAPAVPCVFLRVKAGSYGQGYPHMQYFFSSSLN